MLEMLQEVEMLGEMDLSLPPTSAWEGKAR